MPEPTKIETLPLPDLGMTAYQYAFQNFQADARTIAEQVLAAMGLSPKDGWKVNFVTGEVSRAVMPDSPAPTP